VRAFTGPRTWWWITGLYVLFVYATVPVVPRIRQALCERFGYGIYDLAYPVFAVIGLLSLLHIVRKTRFAPRIRTILGLAVLAIVYALVLRNLKYGVERFHFLQYGFLAFLLLGCIREKIHDAMGYLFVLVLVYCVGLGDEMVQALVPGRVGEISDVGLNVFAGALGLAATALAVPAWRPIRPIAPLTSLRILELAMFSVLFTLFFLGKFHGFGTRIERPDTGVFYSSFREDELQKIDEAIRRGRKVDPGLLRVYTNEAIRHLVQRDFYDTNKFYIFPGQYYVDWQKSRNENRVLEKYYGAYLDQNERRWPPARDRGNPNQDLPWESRVKSTMVTTFTFRFAAGAAGFVFLAFLGLLWPVRKWKRE